MLINCNECGKEYSDQSRRCVHCGARNEVKREARQAATGNVILWVVGIVIGLAFLVAISPQRTDEERALDKAIELCDEQWRNSNASPVVKAECDKLREERWRSSRQE